MGSKSASGYCSNCQRDVLAVRQTPNHVLHLLLAIVTSGLWIIIWVLVAVRRSAPRCTNCGKKADTGLVKHLNYVNRYLKDRNDQIARVRVNAAVEEASSSMPSEKIDEMISRYIDRQNAEKSIKQSASPTPVFGRRK
jgi:hypothetical protein